MKLLTELPLLEAILWESAWAAEVEGDHADSVALGAQLGGLEYTVMWERDAMQLLQRRTGAVMRWETMRGQAASTGSRRRPTTK